MVPRAGARSRGLLEHAQRSEDVVAVVLCAARRRGAQRAQRRRALLALLVLLVRAARGETLRTNDSVRSLLVAKSQRELGKERVKL